MLLVRMELIFYLFRIGQEVGNLLQSYCRICEINGISLASSKKSGSMSSLMLGSSCPSDLVSQSNIGSLPTVSMPPRPKAVRSNKSKLDFPEMMVGSGQDQRLGSLHLE